MTYEDGSGGFTERLIGLAETFRDEAAERSLAQSAVLFEQIMRRLHQAAAAGDLPAWRRAEFWSEIHEAARKMSAEARARNQE